MTVVKIILYSLGGFLLATSFCGALVLANVDKPTKNSKRFYRWLFFIGLAAIVIAILITLLKEPTVITVC